MEINRQGGIVPASVQDAARARQTDLITLPPEIPGTHCGNCLYIKDIQRVGRLAVGFCVHPLVQQPVSDRMCCALWDAQGVIRDF